MYKEFKSSMFCRLRRNCFDWCWRVLPRVSFWGILPGKNSIKLVDVSEVHRSLQQRDSNRLTSRFWMHYIPWILQKGLNRDEKEIKRQQPKPCKMSAFWRGVNKKGYVSSHSGWHRSEMTKCWASLCSRFTTSAITKTTITQLNKGALCPSKWTSLD